jgi:hypothetical protein
MKSRYIHIISAIALLSTLIACNNDESKKRKMPNMKESYLHKDKNPFGTFIAYKAMEGMYYRNILRDDKKTFEDNWTYSSDTGCILVNISKTLYTTDEDVTAVINFAEKGNDVFFAVEQFDFNLLNKLRCGVNRPGLTLNIDSPYKYTSVNMLVDGDPGWSYSYYYTPFDNAFVNHHSEDTKVLGVNETGDPNFIVIFKGKGRIFLHCEPRAFSNYFLLQGNNYYYAQKAFGYLRAYPEHVYWNEYYVTLKSRDQAMRRRSNSKDFSSTGEIMKHPSLAIAFWLTLALLLLYILFALKRRQRIIETVKPNENTTVTFTETIGRLYLQKKDNRNIADKMITYFNEHVRSSYFLNTSVINKEFISTLSRKSGVQLEVVEKLYNMFNQVQRVTYINDLQLLTLNEQIQQFYKRV